MKKYIGLILIIILIFTITSLIIINKKNDQITNLEKIYIENYSAEITPYISILEDKNNLDNFIIYALEYNYNNTLNTELKISELTKIINEIFYKKISEDDIKKIGLTPIMVEKNIDFYPDKEIYVINNKNESLYDISVKPIKKYTIKDIKKKKDEITVIYNKYVISNPYEIVNYYSNNKKEEIIDLEDINKYLNNKTTRKKIDKYLTDELLNKIATKEKTITIIYIIQENSLYIKSIK